MVIDMKRAGKKLSISFSSERSAKRRGAISQDTALSISFSSEPNNSSTSKLIPSNFQSPFHRSKHGLQFERVE